MSAEEAEWTIAALRQQVADLAERVEYLETRAGKHNCLVDCCDFDDNLDCVLAPGYGSEA